MSVVVVAGYGEIGKAIYQLCRGGFDEVLVEDPCSSRAASTTYNRPAGPAALHIAIPGTLENFQEEVQRYYDKYNPEIVLIHSTTVPGTTEELELKLGTGRVVHAQVHGKHCHGRMRTDMLYYPKFVGTVSDSAFALAQDVLQRMGHPEERIIRLPSSRASEVVKLLSTSFYGYMIVWMQEMKRLSAACNIPVAELMTFTCLQTDDFSIRDKFAGEIGGHCVMPNIEILRKTYPLSVWNFIHQSNEEMKHDG